MYLRLQQQKRENVDAKMTQIYIELISSQMLTTYEVISLLKSFAEVTSHGERVRACISEVTPSVKYIIHEINCPLQWNRDNESGTSGSNAEIFSGW